MTIAIAVKVGDGVVLGADSAATLSGEGGVVNVYFNAEKITNLVKGLPLGMAVYGLGGLGGRSVSSLAKDLRTLFNGQDDHWRLDPDQYTMKWVADRVRQFFYEDRYRQEFPKKIKGPDGREVDQWAQMGFFIAGFSAKADQSEIWAVEINQKGECPEPTLVYGQDNSGSAVWAGAPEALNRLMRGWSSHVFNGLTKSGVPAADVEKFLSSLPVEPLIQSAMPLQDAIDLVKFMVDVTVGFVKFIPGAPTVADPTDIAAITKHEGFRWVRRKHYYPVALNPPLSQES